MSAKEYTATRLVQLLGPAADGDTARAWPHAPPLPTGTGWRLVGVIPANVPVDPTGLATRNNCGAIFYWERDIP